MERSLSRRHVGRLAAAGLAAALLVPAGGVRADGPVNSWYFAEGYTGDGFDTYLSIMNPTPVAASVRVTYFLDQGEPIQKGIDVGAYARQTIPVHDDVLGIGRGKAVSFLVERIGSADGIVVERPIYFTYTHPGEFSATGGHNVLGATEPRTTWYFAEGYTGAGFDQFISVMNPEAADASVRITYYLTNGQTVTKVFTAPAKRRSTVTVHDTALGVGRQPAGVGVSAKVESTNGVGIVAERPMYFSYGPGWADGHNVMGAFAPSTTWYFADGSTGTNRDTFLTINNPDPTYAASVQLTYSFNNGTTRIKKPVTVNPNTRFTVSVFDGSLSDTNVPGIGRGSDEVSIRVESLNGVGIVAERPIYFDYNGWSGGMTTVGAVAPQNTWFFAEGYTGTGFDEYLVILNPNRASANVTITYFLNGGSAAPITLSVGGLRRRTIAVFGSAANGGVGRDQAVAAKVESEVTIVVERPMYFSYGAGWTGGHTLMGFPSSYL